MTVREETARLNRVLTLALEPSIREQIVAEVRRHTDSDDPISLADWLRNRFMTWLPNVPICECGTVMSTSVYKFEREIAWTPDPSAWTGFRPRPGPETLCGKVERYTCLKCYRVRVASRENHPLVLLRTRVGRCGEIAILFTSILIALGHQARLMFTMANDHLWTEVYINGGWMPIDVSAPDVRRLVKDRFTFEGWGWRLADLYAIEPGKQPILVTTYRREKPVTRQTLK